MGLSDEEIKIRRTIFELFECKSNYCHAYRLSNGHILIDEDGDVREIDLNGEYVDDPIDFSQRTKRSSTPILCTECPEFDECIEVDMLISLDYESEYGKATSVDDVIRAKEKKDHPEPSLSPWVFECPFCMSALTVPPELDNIATRCPSCNEEIFLSKEDMQKEKFIRKKGCFTIECPFCNQRIDVPNELENTVAKCPACSEEIFFTKEDAIG